MSGSGATGMDTGIPTAGIATGAGGSGATGATGVGATTGGVGGEGHSLSNLGDLIGDISRDLSLLLSQEAALAKAEVAASAKRGGKGAGLLGGAGVAGHFVLLFLSVALWWGVGDLIGLGWSAVVVALLWGVVAAVLALAGRKELKEIKGIPQTTATAKEIPGALKGNEDRA